MVARLAVTRPDTLPLPVGHALKACSHQCECALAAGGCAYRSCSAAKLAIQLIDGVVGADASPVPHREAHVGRRLRDTVTRALGSCCQPYIVQVFVHAPACSADFANQPDLTSPLFAWISVKKEAPMINNTLTIA